MDLITYLKNTNNEDLYQKLKEIVDLYNQLKVMKENLKIHNDDYNKFLIEKNKISSNKPKKENINTPSRLYLILFVSLIMYFVVPIVVLILMKAPIPLLMLISFILFLLNLYKRKKKKRVQSTYCDKKKVESIQDVLYYNLCEVRDLYYAKKKELDKAVQKLNKNDLKLIDDFYGALKEYDEYLELLSIDLEEKEIAPTEETNKTLEQRNI